MKQNLIGAKDCERLPNCALDIGKNVRVLTQLMTQ